MARQAGRDWKEELMKHISVRKFNGLVDVASRDKDGYTTFVIDDEDDSTEHCLRITAAGTVYRVREDNGYIAEIKTKQETKPQHIVDLEAQISKLKKDLSDKKQEEIKARSLFGPLGSLAWNRSQERAVIRNEISRLTFQIHHLERKL